MDTSDSKTQSFIIRIWREDNDGFTWRGHITHVPSGEKQYIQELEGISMFVLRYLAKMEVKASRYQRFRQWCRDWQLVWRRSGGR